MTSATARGLATITHAGTVLDVWFPAPRLSDDPLSSGTEHLDQTPQQFAALVGPDEDRGVARIAVTTSLASLSEAPVDAYDAYLRLHLLSHRLVRPHQVNLTGVYDLLANVVWTNYGPCAVADFQMVRGRLTARGPVTVYSVDKFPRMVDYVVPSGVRIADADRVRLGAHLAEGTTVMHEGFVNYNAGTLGDAMVEGRLSSGVVIGKGTDIGGGASVMGTLSGGGKEVISIGERCLLGANSGIGISLGDNCIVEAGLYVTAGTKVSVFGDAARIADVDNGTRIKAAELSGADNILYRRNSLNGAVEATPVESRQVDLNGALHHN
ncbi:2,3,4,5-tetrahydropyridine-2,6-dicarboxylate N-succinyltransferase [Corynebacterium hylobatis]|uniref:2,3,4,5-tetrahydropyridine-2,6-dicarboxylate N-succinyltransferase n=1 Tax=Corynebacterium hylobatis TaxID=1859290 RepID=A0A3S0HIV9_9CORY|nr:2,3,4,5-tetrahydropyridine-2,6-dicarboxylate N-succinyltransferase [Corynebacterium hylobatis]RSZ65485.1 2,3,4,5-tetrahydropyridine-2,6-dicarboxylate N-succinyltransferase [Corynebacterium hylobatis]